MSKFDKSILRRFDDIIDEIIAETEDSYTDEILCDMQQDPEYRQSAFEYFLGIIEDEYDWGQFGIIKEEENE